MCKHAHARGSGDVYLKKIKSGALRSLLKPYLYPNATRLHGNTAVRYDTHQSSQGTSVTVVDVVCDGPGPDEVGILNLVSLYFVLHYETRREEGGGACPWYPLVPPMIKEMADKQQNYWLMNRRSGYEGMKVLSLVHGNVTIVN